MQHAKPGAPSAPSPILSRIAEEDVETFMKTDWHRNARLFRNAIADFEPFCSIDELLELAKDPDAETRLIEQTETGWSLTHGPLDELPPRSQKNWTVLVQGLNLMLDPAARLLDRFRFVPDARLDDLMVSFATDGGGVGPHFDSYDVFLLQMHGQRRWRISAQTSLDLVENMPLKILRDFKPEQEFVLNPGDMLYLPPRYAHDGVAIGECTTLSIGFRSPTAAELLSSVFQQLAEDVRENTALLAQRFADPQRGVCQQPALLPDDMVQWVTSHLQGFKPDIHSIEKGLLRERTEPKDNVIFNAPMRAPTGRSVLRTFTTRGIRLHKASRLMTGERGFAMNGEWFEHFTQDIDKRCLSMLAHARMLSPQDLEGCTQDSAFTSWCLSMMDAGWIESMPD